MALQPRRLLQFLFILHGRAGLAATPLFVDISRQNEPTSLQCEVLVLQPRDRANAFLGIKGFTVPGCDFSVVWSELHSMLLHLVHRR